MAKKSKKKANQQVKNTVPENMLPQNILPVGERVTENKNIYISQYVYKQIHQFTKNKTSTESGGMLIGKVIEEFGKSNIVISGFVEAKYCDATPTTLKFTHETWEYVHKEIDKKHKGKKIVGWIHTHPDFGIFLSDYDKFIHQNFFSDENQVAYVIDPIQKIEGFYFWINGNLEKCKGFYVFDSNGQSITMDEVKESDVPAAPAAAAPQSIFTVKNLIIGLLAVAVIFLIFAQISTSKQLKELEESQETLVNSANNALASMQQTIQTQSTQISELQMQVQALMPAEVPETDTSVPAEEATDAPVEGDASEEAPTEATEEAPADVTEEAPTEAAVEDPTEAPAGELS